MLNFQISNIPIGTYFITGATGFIGSLIIRTLLESKDYQENKIKIIGLIRNQEKAEVLYAPYDKKNIIFVQSDIKNLDTSLLRNEYNIPQIDYIFHCAANTRSSDMIQYPVETAQGIVIGTNNILNLATDYSITSMVYLSSMEVYGQVEYHGVKTIEDKLGNIDITSPRSCYPLGKRMAENLCCCYYSQHQTPVKIARLAQTFGPGILPDESRIFSQFARCTISKDDIILHTKGDSTGNYVDSYDAVTALFLLLSAGENGQAYNVCNECNTMTILDMARLVAAEIAHNQIDIRFEIPKTNHFGYAPKTQLQLSSKKIRNLGWTPKFGLIDMYLRMIQEL